jgi:hypothetical protein
MRCELGGSVMGTDPFTLGGTDSAGFTPLLTLLGGAVSPVHGVDDWSRDATLWTQ